MLAIISLYINQCIDPQPSLAIPPCFGSSICRSQGLEGLRAALPQQRPVGRLPALRAEPRHGGAQPGMAADGWWVVGG